MSVPRTLSRASFDWTLFFPAVALSLIGMLTMSTFGQGASLASRQMLWLAIASGVYFVLSMLDMRFIRRASVVIALYGVAFALLALVLLVSDPVMGARAWFSLGPISFQPADLAKFAIIALLAKYLSRRHVEIGDFRHIIVSGVYTFILALFILIEPDMGNTIIFGSLWLGMMLVSGISKKHLALLGIIGIIVASVFWFEGLKPYQRTRIISFVNPASDIHGAGYNAYQAKIAVGSGELFGKGIGYGTQSKLRFLPEYQTDFIFAAFAEEWGFIGALFLFISFATLIFRILYNASKGESNFEILFGIGLAILFITHFTINVGMNIGLLPVTGIPLPFVSYGGSYLLTSFAGLGILMGMRKYARPAHKDLMKNEFLGI